MLKYTCWKCGDPSHLPEKTSLIGGYNAKVCAQCLNDFHEFIVQTPEWRDIIDNEARLAVSVEQADEEKTIRLNRERQVTLEALYAIGKNWCPAPIPDPAKNETNEGKSL